MSRVTVYTRVDCHLCDEAVAQVRVIAAEPGAHVVDASTSMPIPTIAPSTATGCR